MQGFLMQIGHPGHVDVGYTVTRRRSIKELLDALPPSAPERDFFANSSLLHSAFPNGQFNCWGVPGLAQPAFDRTQISDLVLFAPRIGIHDGGIHQLGVVKALCPVRALVASQILWPDTERTPLSAALLFRC